MIPVRAVLERNIKNVAEECEELIMVQPEKVKEEAKKREDENYKFRTYLKCHADEMVLDGQFLALHRELFEEYDCSKCRNCCKQYHGSIPAEDVERDAEYLNMTRKQFADLFLKEDEYGISYETKHKPCDFLMDDGSCRLGDCKPDSCKKYPYTDQPERLESLLSFLDIVEICPVAFEICERLKKEYTFCTSRFRRK